MDYWFFILICIIATATPGPAVFLVIKNSTFYGIKKTLIGILGNLLAMSTMAFVSAAGLGTLILASSTLFFIIKVLGGLYLIYLGIKTFRTCSYVNNSLDKKLKSKSGFSLFKEAYFVGISNPKAIAFYTALFPQFLDLNHSVIPQFFLLTVTFVFFSFFFLSTYALLASKLKSYLLKQRIAKWFNKVIGSLFISFGVAIATSK